MNKNKLNNNGNESIYDISIETSNQKLESLNTNLVSIEEHDPSLSGGYKIIYDRETPFELRVQQTGSTPQQVGALEAIKVKILILGNENAPESVKIELATESDLFYHYTHTCDLNIFRSLQEEQKLMVDFPDYPNILIRMFNNCIKEPNNHLAIFLMLSDGRARLDFIKNMEYKFVELLSTTFIRTPQEIIQHHITYRYNTLKAKLNIMQSRLTEVNNIIKLKNPSLLLQLQKSSVSSPSGINANYTTK